MKKSTIYTTYELSEENMNEFKEKYPNEELEFKIYPFKVSKDNGYDNPTTVGFVKLADAEKFFEEVKQEFEKQEVWNQRLVLSEGMRVIKESVGKHYDSDNADELTFEE